MRLSRGDLRHSRSRTAAPLNSSLIGVVQMPRDIGPTGGRGGRGCGAGRGGELGRGGGGGGERPGQLGGGRTRGRGGRGRQRGYVGGQVYQYDPSHYLVVSVPDASEARFDGPLATSWRFD